MKRTLIAGAAVALAAVAFLATHARAGTPPPPPAAAVTARVASAEPRPVKSAPREQLTGAVAPLRGLQFGFEVPGRLARILVRKGAPVREGAIVAQLDAELADAQVRQAEAALEAAEAQAALAQDVAARNAQLQGTVPDVQRHTSASQAAAAAAQVEAARAQLAQARVNRRRHDLRAPFAGVLVDAPEQVGAAVNPGTPLFTLEQLDQLLLKVTVSEAARTQLRPGARLHVEAVNGGAQTDAATVRAVILSADAATRRIPVEIVVPNRDGRFVAHTLARADLPVGEAEDALALPASALSSQGGDHVFALNGDEVRRVDVEVLDRGAAQVVVKPRGKLTKVVDYPAPDLADGARVTVQGSAQ